MSNVPKLRFKEFSGDWESKKLGNVAQIVGGGTPSTTESEYWNGNIPWFTPTEIKSQKFVGMSGRAITEEGLKKSSAKILPKGTVLLTTRASLGDMAISNREVTTNQGFQSIIAGNDIINEFIYYLQPKLKKYCYKNASGSTFLEISKSNIEQFKFNMPSKEEQEKIASFFSLIDDKISLQGEKVEALKDYKKGMMQKIFSRELRFKDDDGRDYPEWEEKRFRDFVKINQGLQIPISERYTSEGENRYFYITNEFLKSSSDNKYYIENPPKSVICREDDILMTRTGNTGKVVTGVSGAFHNNFFKIDYDRNKYDKMFLYYVLTSSNMQKNIIRLAGTSTIPDLNHGDFYNIKVNLPVKKEQDKISTLFVNLDIKINKEQNKLDSLSEYKKGLLQQMFV